MIDIHFLWAREVCVLMEWNFVVIERDETSSELLGEHLMNLECEFCHTVFVFVFIFLATKQSWAAFFFELLAAVAVAFVMQIKCRHLYVHTYIICIVMYNTYIYKLRNQNVVRASLWSRTRPDQAESRDKRVGCGERNKIEINWNCELVV